MKMCTNSSVDVHMLNRQHAHAQCSMLKHKSTDAKLKVCICSTESMHMLNLKHAYVQLKAQVVICQMLKPPCLLKAIKLSFKHKFILWVHVYDRALDEQQQKIYSFQQSDHLCTLVQTKLRGVRRKCREAAKYIYYFCAHLLG